MIQVVKGWDMDMGGSRFKSHWIKKKKVFTYQEKKNETEK